MYHTKRQASGDLDSHTGHKIPETHASHDPHAGHSVTMLRDKFLLYGR
jgi:hypothetical protein